MRALERIRKFISFEQAKRLSAAYLLIKDSSWTIHENNIHTLLIEIYKSLNDISPPIMQEFFDLKVTPLVLETTTY